ncbi:unnamed protein product, partial [Prunus brigantina]
MGYLRSMEQCRQGKSAKWIRNLGKRIGSRGWARGSRSRTRRLSVDCSSCSRGESGSPRAGRGDGTGSVPSGTFPGRRTRAASDCRIHQVLDCSPTNRERELGLDRRETTATHPTLCIFTCLPCHALGLPCLALALACLGFGLPCLGLALALPCLAMSCLRLGMPCVGIALLCVALACRALACLGLGNGIAPIKLFRESEAIGSLARHGLGLALACAFRESEAIGSLAWRGL